MRYQKYGIDLLLKHTHLLPIRALTDLNRYEDLIRCKEIYKNNENITNSYFLLAAGYVMENYKNETRINGLEKD